MDAEHGLVIFRRQPPHTFQKSDFAVVSVSEVVNVEDVGPSPAVGFAPRRLEAAEIRTREAEGEARCVPAGCARVRCGVATVAVERRACGRCGAVCSLHVVSLPTDAHTPQRAQAAGVPRRGRVARSAARL